VAGFCVLALAIRAMQTWRGNESIKQTYFYAKHQPFEDEIIGHGATAAVIVNTTFCFALQSI